MSANEGGHGTNNKQNGFNDSHADDDDDDDKHGKSRGDSNELKTPSSSKDASKNSTSRKKGTMTEDTCSASTAVTATSLTPYTPYTAASDTSSGSHLQTVEMERRREQLQHQIIILSVATSMAVGFFIWTLLPLAALVALGFLATSAGLLSRATYQRLLLEYQEIVAGEGFGRYLPPGLYQQLTELSLHEFMMDGSFARE